MVPITANRRVQCKSTIGGIKKAFLAPYKKVQRSEIIYDGVSLLGFPETFFYTFDLIQGPAFLQQQNENEGGKYFDVSLSLNFNKITAFDNLQFQKLLKKDYFLIVLDSNDNYFLLGFRNGITAESLKTTTTQFTIDFKGMEEEFAPFVNDIMGTDIITVEGLNYIFQDGNDFIFQNDTNYIFQ